MKTANARILLIAPIYRQSSMHAYMSGQKLWLLTGYRTMPLTLISSLIDPHTLNPIPVSAERGAFFEKNTTLKFSMALVTELSDVVTVDCPFCLQKNHLVKWVDADEKGFAEPKFGYTCESCEQVFTKSNIGVRRFAEEFTMRRTGKKVYISCVKRINRYALRC